MRPSIDEKVQNFKSAAQAFATAFEEFVEKNVFNKETRDQHLKTMFKKLEGFIKETVSERFSEPQVLDIKIKRLENFTGDLPAYQSRGASGFDVRAQLTNKILLKPGERALVPTGLSFETPEGFEIQARPRSGLAAKKGISVLNTPGTIDSDYRGEVKIILVNFGEEDVTIENQERIAQLVVCPIVKATFVETVDLSSTDRDAGGFGSTGLN